MHFEQIKPLGSPLCIWWFKTNQQKSPLSKHHGFYPIYLRIGQIALIACSEADGEKQSQEFHMDIAYVLLN